MDDRTKARTWQHPEYIPVRLGVLPSAWIKYRDELAAIARRHPLLFGKIPGQNAYDSIAGGTYVAGDHVDAWGCVWSNVHTGREAIVTGHPLPRREDVRTLQMPKTDAGLPHGFMWLRLADLRGFDEIMMDFAEEPPELQQLLDTVLAYNLRQLEREIAKRQEPGMYWFGDDLGMQHSLAISPAKWRRYLKPCYSRLYARWHEAGHVVYMHTDGHIIEIIPDLIDCGVDVLNPQVRANGLKQLRQACYGKVCVDLDLDRQMFPFCRPADIDAHVHEAVVTLGAPEGGLWLTAEVDDGVPLENIEAICSALEKYRACFRPDYAS